MFATPVRELRDGKTFFSVDLTRPDEPPKGPGFTIRWSRTAGAVSGILPYF